MPNFEFHAGQSKAFMSPARFTALIAGTGGGKTWFGPRWLMNEIDRCERLRLPSRHIIMSPTYSMLNREPIPELLRAFEGTKYKGHLRRGTPLQYHLPGADDRGNRTIYFISADNPAAAESGQYDSYWGDEPGQYGPQVWINVQSRLGIRGGRALLTGTPTGRNWFFSDFYKRAQSGDPNYHAVQFGSAVNPYYPKEEIERMRHVLPPLVFDMRYGGQFTQISGLVYPMLARAKVAHRLIPNPQPDWELLGGLDFGWTNPACCLSSIKEPLPDGRDIIWVYRQMYGRNVSNAMIAESMVDRTEYACDPAEPKSIDDIKEKLLRVHPGAWVKPANNDVMLGLEAVTTRLLEGTLRISEDCDAVWSEGETYCIDEKGRPIKGNDHAMDALRYLVATNDLARGVQDFEVVEFRESAKWRNTNGDGQASVTIDSDNGWE